MIFFLNVFLFRGPTPELSVQKSSGPLINIVLKVLNTALFLLHFYHVAGEQMLVPTFIFQSNLVIHAEQIKSKSTAPLMTTAFFVNSVRGGGRVTFFIQNKSSAALLKCLALL